MKFGAGLATLGALVVVPALGRAQGELVVPAGYETQDAPGAAMWAISPFAARRQILLGPSHLAGALQQTLTGLDLRRNLTGRRPKNTTKLGLQIWLSHSSRPADQPLMGFAANRGVDQTLVFADEVTLVPGPATAQPPSWEMPRGVNIDFASTFVYTGGTLCIEVVTTPEDPGQVAWWPLDAYVERSAGTVSTFGTGCLPGVRAGVDPGSAALGGSLAMYLRGDLEDQSSGCCVLGTSATDFGGVSLPFDLTPLGAPGCWIHAALMLALPSTANELLPADTLATASIALPLSGALAGASLYGQWVWPDDANPMGLAFSEGLRVVLAPPAQLGDLSWVESVDPASPTGDIYAGRVPVLRLRW